MSTVYALSTRRRGTFHATLFATTDRDEFVRRVTSDTSSPFRWDGSADGIRTFNVEHIDHVSGSYVQVDDVALDDGEPAGVWVTYDIPKHRDTPISHVLFSLHDTAEYARRISGNVGDSTIYATRLRLDEQVTLALPRGLSNRGDSR